MVSVTPMSYLFHILGINEWLECIEVPELCNSVMMPTSLFVMTEMLLLWYDAFSLHILILESIVCTGVLPVVPRCA